MSAAADALVGLSAKDWSLIIVLLAIAFTFVVVGVGLAVAIASGAIVTFAGEFNLNDYQAALLLLVGAGITMVTQQLTTKQNIAAKNS